MTGQTPHGTAMGWTKETSHHLLIALVFSAIIGLITCAAYLTQPDWRLLNGAGHGTSLTAPMFGSERR